jgi:predicted kinase
MATPPRPTLVLVCGLPGAGKTTLSRQLEKAIPALRLCPDEWIAALDFPLHDEARRSKLEALFWSLAQDLLQKGQSVILEFGFWGRSERETKRLAARRMEVRVELHYLAAPIEELWHRLEVRNRMEEPGTVPITRAQLVRWAGMFQPPDATELDLYDSAVRHSLL